MVRDYIKEYIELSNEFRKSSASKESVAKLYDLLYDLEKTSRTKQYDLVLSNVYSLLGFHESAFEVFKTIADLTNRKDLTKMYVMEGKAKSHKDNFIIKDIRKYREKKEQPTLDISDFIALKNDKKQFEIANKSIVVFNKIIKNDALSIHLPSENIAEYLDRIANHIIWLANCKTELIGFYNKEDNEEKANEDWYDTLAIYSTQITIEESGAVFTAISAGDDFYQDHLLDIEIVNDEIISMYYNG